MSEELDVEELRSELETIKDAMGIRERYPSQFRLWLVYGVLVGLAALGSQAVVLYDLPGWGHWVAWGGLMGLGGVYQWVGIDREMGAGGSSDAKPNVGVHYLAAFGYAFAVLAAVSPLFDGAEAAVLSSTVFAVVVGAVGLAYVLVGNALKAYYIRRRDRLAFYLGGAWMLGLAAVIPNVPALRRWGYAVFGIAFALHAVGSYIALARA
ncbi:MULTISPECIES: hypothetical protein [Salinibaculum]|uniref:hypothetical protein n=1 Tax=Salinibaculum TaxID=2732368 RepID=UPI0030D4EA09